MEKKYFHRLDIVRLLACIGVLLYHLNILKGGYLAVCVFFVLSGYLGCISAFKKEKFSILNYYKTRFVHIYLPLLIVVFSSIVVISLIPSINWLNLKPETTSVILGYNNFWQLSANLDYFARHINSPFMHLWYIGILLQFEIIFPLIFILFKKIGNKIGKYMPCVITIVLGLASAVYFYISSLNGNTMSVYYNTFTRVFSLFFGVFLGFIHSYYGQPVFKLFKNKIVSALMFSFYLIGIIILCIFIPADSKYYAVSMIGVSILSLRLIDYAVVFANTKSTVFDKVVKFLASISYEVYLVQYPVIFLTQYMNIASYLKIPFIIVTTLIISIVIHFATTFKNTKSGIKIFKGFVLVVLLALTSYGVYKYVITEDHTKEMKALEEQLNQNEKMVEEKQAQYAAKLKEEEDNWKAMLEDFENGESKVAEMVINLPIVCVGDSVMLGAAQNLYNKFPNSYVDAKVSRTAWVLNDILIDLKNSDMLGEPIVLNLGANGRAPDSVKIPIMKTIGDRKVFWVNVTNDADVNVNADLVRFAKDYPNLYIIDWESISRGHSEYFYSDGIHLTGSGRIAYTNAVYDAIYKVYLDEFNAKKEELLKKHDEEQKNKISFYGNDVLINSFEKIQEKLETANFTTSKEYTFESLKKQLSSDIENKSLAYNVVFVFDKNFNLTKTEYLELIKLCENHQIYIVNTNIKELTFDDENVKVIDFYDEMKANLMVDGIHLTEDGNKLLSEIIINAFTNDKED